MVLICFVITGIYFLPGSSISIAEKSKDGRAVSGALCTELACDPNPVQEHITAFLKKSGTR